MLFRYLFKSIFFIKTPISSRENLEERNKVEEKEPENLNVKLQVNLDKIQGKLTKFSDLRVREFSFGANNNIKGAVIYLDGMVDFQQVTDTLIRPLLSWKGSGIEKTNTKASREKLLNAIRFDALASPDCEIKNTIDDVISEVFIGETVLIVDGLDSAFTLGTQGWEQRTIIEPQSEIVLRGPREGFVENFKVNIALIRRKIRSEKLKVEEIVVGRKTKTVVSLLYLEGIADPTVLKKIRYRLSELKVDSVLESGYIEQYIEDFPFSPFATVGHTEKPDVAAGKILEGRVALVVDGTPIVLTVPYLLIESLQSSEDYYNRWMYASLTRILRFIGLFLAIFTPAIYIALTSFHQELIPTKLLFTIAIARQGTPFPIFVEAIIMVFAYELLREAGIRLPRAVGQAISIVGALIMGEAAVQAGIVGAPMVIVMAATAVAGFIVPALNESVAIIRLIMIGLAAFLGFYGIGMGTILLLTHLASLNSFGIPYLDHVINNQMQDIFTRPPLWAMPKRPEDIARGNMNRREFFVPPKRPADNKEKEKVNKNQGKTKQQLEE